MTLTTLTKKHYICINIDSISLKKIETSQQNSPNNKVYKRYIPDKKKYMIPSILIIEDDLTFATMLKTWLGKKGFEVDTAGSSSRAKKQLSARSYDLILSDLRLPDQDGIHLLAWLRSQSCTTPFIIMTSYAEIQTAVQAIKQGASDYIAKPVQPDELLKK